jgi:hypothetical protein
VLTTYREGKDCSPSAPSYAAVGSEALTALEKSNKISVEPSGTDSIEGAPVASSDDLERLRLCATERALVAAITPLLRAARGFGEARNAAEADPCARVLVNSERVAWLDALHAPLPAEQLKKPDLFATWAPFWSGTDDPAHGAFGRLAARALQLDGCACEFYEAKVGAGELSVSDFGQLVDYHSRLPGSVRSALFNAREFWLVHSIDKDPLLLIKSEWQARGSRALLRSFFADAPEPPLVPLLRHVARALRVGFVRVECAAATAGGALPRNPATSSFLGAGGSSRVFAVRPTSDGGVLRALKVSAALSKSALAYEFDV